MQNRCVRPDHTGVKLKSKEMKALESEVVRLAGLGKWFVEIPAKVRDG